MKALKTAIALFVFAFAITQLSYIAFSNDALANAKAHYPIGQIAALQGSVYYVKGEKRAEIKVGDPIFFNSVIATDAASRALVMFIDDTQITLGDDSELIIDEYVFDPYDAEENKGRFSVPQGTFRWVSGLISKRETPDVRINTGIGSIGIRGTTLWGGKIAGNYGVFVKEGLVNFSGEFGTVDLKEGEGVFVSQTTILKDVAQWPAEKKENASAQVRFSNDPALKKKVEEIKHANILKRHDYRGRMFPYKANPLQHKLKVEEKDGFSEEFEKLRNK